MAQTTVVENLAIGQEGQTADNGMKDQISRPVLVGGGSIPFGLAVVAGANETATLPSAGGQDFLGVSVLEHSVPNPNATPDAQLNATGTPVYEETDAAGILKGGRIYVRVEVAVAIGDDVFFRHTAPGSEQVGAFRNDNDGGNADQVAGGAAWSQGAAAGELAVLDLNLPA